MRRSIVRDRRTAFSVGITAAAVAGICSTAFAVDHSHKASDTVPEVQPLAEQVTSTPESSTTMAPAPAPAPTGEPQVPLTQHPAGPLGIPGPAMAGYQAAADKLRQEMPGCALDWTLLAGIGQVETNHGYGKFDDFGNTTERIVGPRLDGAIPGTQIIKDTDKGELDGDPEFDRAVGPVQFIPETWRKIGRDGNGDGKADPNNIFDSAYSTAHYLCDNGGDMDDPAQRAAAIKSYNASDAYVTNVNAWATAYQTGVEPRPEDLPPIHEPKPKTEPIPDKCPEPSVGTPTAAPVVEFSGTPEEKTTVPGCTAPPAPPVPAAPPAPPAPEPAPAPAGNPEQFAAPAPSGAPSSAPAPGGAPHNGQAPAAGLPFELPQIQIPGLPPA